MITANIFGTELKSKAPSLLLTNKIGGYFYYSLLDFSKYQGFFFNSSMQLYKTLEKVNIGDFNAKKIEYKKNCIEIIGEKGKQVFSVIENEDALVYETDIDEISDFVFDCRDAYDMNDWGRYYEISVENNVILVKYKKVADYREQNKSEYEVYVAIASDNLNYSLTDKWVKKDYIFDKGRLDVSQRYVYEAFSLKAKKAILAFSLNKEEAIKKAREIFEKKVEQDNDQIKIDLKIDENEVNCAYFLSLNSLDSLTVNKDKTFGIYAGLPWFFQFWTRDSAISSKALSKVNKDLTKKIILNYIDNIREDGLIANRFPYSSLDSIDSVGLVFKRISDLLYLFNDNEVNYLYKELKKSLDGILKYHSKNSLIMNNPLETWIDTESRDGICIEIQTLLLSMLSLMNGLAKRFNDKAFEKYAKKKENEIASIVKDEFYHYGVLYDRLGDSTIRPNVFLAYYFYSDLLNSKEWEKVFDSALKELWLEWGGLSTLDKKDVRFCDIHTGMNNRSYHNGDSWFFLNNLAAICMQRLNRKKYVDYINKILKASTSEILHSGIFGYHAELSSARQLESNGCLAQAWSSALYVELINEIYE